MSIEEYANEKLWPVLVDTAHALTMFPHHKAYVRDAILTEKPETNPEELSTRLGIPLGEALTILYELAQEKKPKQ